MVLSLFKARAQLTPPFSLFQAAASTSALKGNPIYVLFSDASGQLIIQIASHLLLKINNKKKKKKIPAVQRLSWSW